MFKETTVAFFIKEHKSFSCVCVCVLSEYEEPDAALISF
jgi:hypothetical protein